MTSEKRAQNSIAQPNPNHFFFLEEVFQGHPTILWEFSCISGFLPAKVSTTVIGQHVCGTSGIDSYFDVTQAVASAASSRHKRCCPLLHVYELRYQGNPGTATTCEF